MHGTTAATQRSRTIRLAQTCAVIALGLCGYALASWLFRSGVSGAPAALVRYPGSAAPGETAISITAAVALAAAAALLGAAVTLRRHDRRARRQPDIQDPVTGLHSAGHVAEVVPRLIERDDRCGRSQLVLVRISVDFLGDVRRRYGDPAADEVLGCVARHIRSQTRGGDVPTVPDPQGFAIFLRCAEIDHAMAFCRRLGTLLRSDQLECAGDVLKVSASMGVALRRIGEPLEALQARALLRLADAQAQGGGKIVG